MTLPRIRLYVWVWLAIVAGGVWGIVDPASASRAKPVADLFVQVIKVLVIPVVFCTVVLGIAGAGGLKRAGRLGLKSILYFEIVSTFALAIGLAVALLLRPGAGFRESTGLQSVTLGPEVAKSLTRAEDAHWLASLFTSGGMIPVLIIALLAGFFVGPGLRARIEALSNRLFIVVDLVMRAAPLAAGSAMAYTIGHYGLASLLPLMNLMLCFYLTCILFVFIVLGWVARRSGFSLWRLLKYLRAELLTVLGTSSSESVLASLIEKLSRAGCDRATVGFVIPTGYSFNLDGTSIYITLAGLFIAQAMGVDLSAAQIAGFLGVAILTSKGAAGVTGSGFVTLAATVAVFPAIPAAGLALILGVDRFMSEARALTNMVGNAVAAVAISQSERGFARMEGAPLTDGFSETRSEP